MDFIFDTGNDWKLINATTKVKKKKKKKKGREGVKLIMFKIQNFALNLLLKKEKIYSSQYTIL